MGKDFALCGNRAVTATDAGLQKGEKKKKTIRIRIEFVSFVFLNMQQFTFINLNRFARGNALYAENLITTYPVCFGRAL